MEEINDKLNSSPEAIANEQLRDVLASGDVKKVIPKLRKHKPNLQDQMEKFSVNKTSRKHRNNLEETRKCSEFPLEVQVDYDRVVNVKEEKDFVYLSAKSTQKGSSIKMKCPSSHEFKLKLSKTDASEPGQKQNVLTLRKVSDFSDALRAVNLFNDSVEEEVQLRDQDLQKYFKYRLIIAFLMLTHIFYVVFVFFVYKGRAFPDSRRNF